MTKIDHVTGFLEAYGFPANFIPKIALSRTDTVPVPLSTKFFCTLISIHNFLHNILPVVFCPEEQTFQAAWLHNF